MDIQRSVLLIKGPKEHINKFQSDASITFLCQPLLLPAMSQYAPLTIAHFMCCYSSRSAVRGTILLNEDAVVHLLFEPPLNQADSAETASLMVAFLAIVKENRHSDRPIYHDYAHLHLYSKDGRLQLNVIRSLKAPNAKGNAEIKKGMDATMLLNHFLSK